MDMDKRYCFFQELMTILDNAEAQTKEGIGSFGFLEETYCIRQITVASLSMQKDDALEEEWEEEQKKTKRAKVKRSSLKQLKTFLVLEVFAMFPVYNRSRITYKDIEADLAGKASKKYCFDYQILDACMADFPNPERLMNRLRTVVWDKLREFFKLCRCESCVECNKRTEVYFKFLQAAALYEIFYREWIYVPYQEHMDTYLGYGDELIDLGKKAVDCAERFGENAREQDMEKLHSYVEALRCLLEYIKSQKEQMDIEGKDVQRYLSLEWEFARSLRAILFLILLLEAIGVSDIKTYDDLKNTAKNMADEIWNKYDKDILIPYFDNIKRRKHYRQINEWLEEYMQAYTLPEYRDERYAGVIAAFMDELCKPKKCQDEEYLKKIEIILGYPIFKEGYKGEWQ